MPVTGTNPNGNFQGLKAENCTIIKLRGLSVLEDDQGHDLLKLLRKGVTSGSSSELEAVVTNLLQRIDVVEKYLQNMPAPTAAVKGPKGDKGDKGDDGEKGETGPQGARGKGASKVSELSDVNLDGLDDGAILMWSSKEKKWVVSLEEQ